MQVRPHIIRYNQITVSNRRSWFLTVHLHPQYLGCSFDRRFSRQWRVPSCSWALLPSFGPSAETLKLDCCWRWPHRQRTVAEGLHWLGPSLATLCQVKSSAPAMRSRGIRKSWETMTSMTWMEKKEKMLEKNGSTGGELWGCLLAR